MIWYALMHPVSPCEKWSHFTPLTQISIEPGYASVFGQSAGACSVVYSPTTWYQAPAAITPGAGCQSAEEPRFPLGLNTYAERRFGRDSVVTMLYMRASHSHDGA